jgi:hypothetical protein
LLSNQLFFARVGTIYLSIPITCLAILTVYLYLDKKLLLYGISAAAMLLVKETTIVILLSIILCDFFWTVLNKEKFLFCVRRIVFLTLPVIPLGFWYLYHWHMTGWLVNTNFLFFNRFLQANKHRLVKIEEFFFKGKRIIIYRKKKEVLSEDRYIMRKLWYLAQ